MRVGCYAVVFSLLKVVAGYLGPLAVLSLERKSSSVISAISPDGSGRDMAAYRASLNEQMKKVESDKFDGYKLCDLIVEKWGYPMDLQFKKEVFAGKPMLYLNVMWKYLGQESFHLTEQEYLEHLEAIAQLLIKWEKVDHIKGLIKDCKKRPKAYFGYAVSLPLDLPPDTILPLFPDRYR